MIKLYFICMGNYYRSRLAEELALHYASKYGLDVYVDSGGLSTIPNPAHVGTVAQGTLRYLANKQITPQHTGRFPKSCSPDGVYAADIVVCTDEDEQRGLFMQQFPNFTNELICWNAKDVKWDPHLDTPQKIDTNVEQLIRSLLSRTIPKNLFDPLAEFHLQQNDDHTYALMAHLVTILQQEQSAQLDSVYRNVANMLGEAEATAMLKLICRRLHIDYLELMRKSQVSTIRHFTPKLLLEMICLPNDYIATRLQIDFDTAEELISKLKQEFTLDDPVYWLKSLLSQIEKERLGYQKAKDDLLHGLDVTKQPVDTAEERKQKEHRLKPWLRPPGPSEGF